MPKPTWLVRDKSFYKRIILIALPLAGQNIISFGVGFADNLMVSQLGESAVGGVFIANQIQNTLQMLTMGLGSALVIIAAQYFGNNNIKAVKTLGAISIKIAAAVGVLLFLLMTFAGRPVLSLFSDAEAVVDEALAYVKILSWSFIFFSVTNVMTAFLRCASSVSIGLWASIVSFVANVALNYLLIFGKLGFPQMGVRGAATATLIARILGFAVVLLYILVVDKKIKWRPRDLLLYDKALLRDYMRYGLPVIAGDVLWGFGGMAQASIIGRLGESVIAANALAGNLGQMFGVMVYGMAGAGSLVVGQAIGRNEFEQARNYTKTLQLVYIFVGIVSGLALLSLRGFVLTFFSELTDETINYGRQFLTVLAFTLMGTAYQMSSLQIVRAGGATHFVLCNDLIFVWLVVIPLSFLTAFVLHSPIWVVFLCLKCDQILKCGVAVIKVNRFRWMKNLVRT